LPPGKFGDRSSISRVFAETSRRDKEREKDPEKLKIKSLTEREREVIHLIGEGLKTNKLPRACSSAKQPCVIILLPFSANSRSRIASN
jgi:hypothetical protein